jgi:hypothetical protein
LAVSTKLSEIVLELQEIEQHVKPKNAETLRKAQYALVRLKERVSDVLTKKNQAKAFA